MTTLSADCRMNIVHMICSLMTENVTEGMNVLKYVYYTYIYIYTAYMCIRIHVYKVKDYTIYTACIQCIYTSEHEYTKSAESSQHILKCFFFPLWQELLPKSFLIFQRLAASLCCSCTCSQCFRILSSLMKAWISSRRRGQWWFSWRFAWNSKPLILPTQKAQQQRLSLLWDSSKIFLPN